MRAGIAAGPHCRRCWHSRIPAPELTASFRRSLPFGSRSCDWVSSGPLRRLAPPASGFFRSGSAFSPAASAVPDHMGLAVAGAVATFRAFPRFWLLLACFLLRSFGHRSLRRCPCGLCLRTDPPRGKRALRRVSACCPSLGVCRRCPRSGDHRPCRISLASGRRSGIRNRSFRCAIRRFQCAPQHAENGFNAYFSVRSDWFIFAFGSVPCGSFPKLHFPLDKADAAPRP